MLQPEEIERLENFSVERERQRYSNEQLWEKLVARKERENQIVQLIPLAYRLGFSWSPDYKFWRDYWNALVDELNANRPVTDLIIWHLTRRGDEAVSVWLESIDQQQRELAAKAQRAAWRMSL